jgi:hypothetical protein
VRDIVYVMFPDNYIPERTWISTVLLSRFGVEVKCIAENRLDWEIKFPQYSSSIVINDTMIGPLMSGVNTILDDPFFVDLDQRDKAILNYDNIPLLHSVKKLGRIFSKSKNGYYCAVDLFGTAFWSMSRLEEFNDTSRLDSHGRFGSSESYLRKGNLIARPFVDEYIELLKVYIMRLWPDIKIREQKFQLSISCDVDNPYEQYVRSLIKLVRKVGGDILIRKNNKKAYNSVKNYIYTKADCYDFDPLDNFEWMMDVNEAAGNVITFYFMAGKSNKIFDVHYNIDEKRVRRLLRRIHERGHLIGLHLSYDSFNNQQQIELEADTLRNVLCEESINQESFGSRQHYLRWSTNCSAGYLDSTDIKYDATLGFADEAGFRCGTSHEFKMFDLENSSPLKIVQRPLVVMECSILDKKYMELNIDHASEYIQQLKNRVYNVNGNFTLLWHNSYFIEEGYKELYLEVIS